MRTRCCPFFPAVLDDEEDCTFLSGLEVAGVSDPSLLESEPEGSTVPFAFEDVSSDGIEEALAGVGRQPFYVFTQAAPHGFHLDGIPVRTYDGGGRPPVVPSDFLVGFM